MSGQAVRIFETEVEAQQRFNELQGWENATVCAFEVVGGGRLGYVIAEHSVENSPLHFREESQN